MEVGGGKSDPPRPDLATVPDATLAYALSFLHGLAIVGPPAATCWRFATACSHRVLCEHVFSRDLMPEDLWALPEQPPRRPPVRAEEVLEARQLRTLLQQQPLLQLDDLRADGTAEGGGSDAAVQQLRAAAAGLRVLPALCIGHAAAKTGRPALLLWAAWRTELHDVDDAG